MPLARGALINWIDIDDADTAIFETWYQGQHLEERVGVPGFVRGRRFRSVDRRAPGQYLTIYTTDDLAVLSSEAYLSRLDNPTDLTRDVVARFTTFRRAASRITAREGEATSGRVAVVEFDPETTRGVAERLDSGILAAARHRGHLLSAMFFEPDTATTAAKAATEEGQAGSESLGPALLVLEVPWTSEAAWFQGIVDELEAMGAVAVDGVRLYDLLADLAHDQLEERSDRASR